MASSARLVWVPSQVTSRTTCWPLSTALVTVPVTSGIATYPALEGFEDRIDVVK